MKNSTFILVLTLLNMGIYFINIAGVITTNIGIDAYFIIITIFASTYAILMELERKSDEN